MLIKELAKKTIGTRKEAQVVRAIKASQSNYVGRVPKADWVVLFEEYARKYGYRAPNIADFASAFFSTKIEQVRTGKVSEDGVILICLEKNDLIRIKELVKHYKKMGVKNIVIIDNQSTDGTVDWLIEETNCDIYRVSDKYTTDRREIWMNRIISIYGYNRWYLIVDSDEFCVYKEMETKHIDEIIAWCENKGIHTVRGMMLDMYSDEGLFSEEEIVDFRKICRFFDGDGYYEVPNKFFRIIRGGVRERALSTPAVLTKYPLFYYQKGVFEESSHYRYPHNENQTAPCLFGILHYKFIDKRDYEKVLQRVKEKNYSNGSEQYVGYLNAYNNNQGVSLRYEKSIEYKDSNSLEEINLINHI